MAEEITLSLFRGIAVTTAQAEEIVHHPLEATGAWLSDVAGDPVAFVEGAFPWGEGALANINGPRAHLEPTNRLGALTCSRGTRTNRRPRRPNAGRRVLAIFDEASTTGSVSARAIT